MRPGPGQVVSGRGWVRRVRSDAGRPRVRLRRILGKYGCRRVAQTVGSRTGRIEASPKGARILLGSRRVGPRAGPLPGAVGPIAWRVGSEKVRLRPGRAADGTGRGGASGGDQHSGTRVGSIYLSHSVYIYIYIYVYVYSRYTLYIYIYMYVYVYIYIYREREIDR